MYLAVSLTSVISTDLSLCSVYTGDLHRYSLNMVRRPSWLIKNKSELYEPQLCYFSPDVLWHIHIYFVHLKI